MNANIDPTPCPTCGGDGLDASHEAALFYAHRGELSPCPMCDGEGTVPATIPVGVYGASAAPPTTTTPCGGGSAAVVGVLADTPTTNNEGGER